MHGFLFAGDLEALRALRSAKLLHLASSRGFDVISSFGYLPWDPSISSSAAIRNSLSKSFLDPRIKSELDDFDFKLVYVHGPSKSPFIKFSPK